jgi:hypothetical protein
MAIQSVKRLQTSPRINTDKRGSEKIARKSFSPLPRSSVFQKVFSAAKSFFFSVPPRLRGRSFFPDQRSSAQICGKIFSSSPCLSASVVDFDFPITRCPDLPILISVISVHQR